MSYTRIGVIANTHGLKGTVKVKSFTDFKEQRYQKGNTLLIKFKQEEIFVTVQKYRTVKTVEYIDFEEFNDINDVEKFKGSELFISDEYIHELDEGEFYFDELIGMDVYMEELVGTCIEVTELPRGHVLVVQRAKKDNALIPFHKEFIKTVDKDQNRIDLIFWEGLL